MALITLPPKFAFSRVSSFKLQRATNTLRSKYTAQRQTIIYPFAVWMLEATLREYDGVDAGKIRSFLAQLEGQKNTFRLPVPGYTKPTAGYNPAGTEYIVNSNVPARATSAQIYTGAANTPIFNEGDFFTVNDELKIVTVAAATNSGGIVTVNFQPPMRTVVLTNTVVVLTNPTCLMTAADDDVANWDIAPPVRQSSKFSAVEAI